MWINVVVTNFLSELRKQLIFKKSNAALSYKAFFYSTLQVWNIVKPFV